MSLSNVLDSVTQQPGDPNLLTARESEVANLLLEGLCNKQIADRLSISIKTVEKHRQSAYRKLDVHHIESYSANFGNQT